MALNPSKEKFLSILGSFWTEVFNDQDAIEQDAVARSLFFQPFADFAASSADYVSVSKIPTHRKEDIVLYLLTDTVYVDDLGIERRTASTIPVAYNDGTTYNAGILYNQNLFGGVYRYPIGSSRVPKYLGNLIDGSSGILIKDRDYTVTDDGHIEFEQPLDNITKPVETLSSDDGKTVYVYHIWGFANDVDEQAVQNMYGYLVRIAGESGDIYKKAVNVAWDLQVTGATVANVDKVLCFLSDVDHYDGPGDERVLNTFIEGNRRWVETASGVWGAPIEAQTLVKVGQVLEEDQQLFDRYTIYDSRQTPDQSAVAGVYIDAGFLGQDYSGPLYLENAYVDVVKQHTRDWNYVDYGGTTWQIRDEAGKIITVVDTEDKARTYLQNVPEDIYTFAITMENDTEWYTLMLWLNSSGFFDNLEAKYGRVPLKIVPLKDLREHMFGSKLTVISVKAAAERIPYVGQLSNVLGRTWPAGMSFRLTSEYEAFEDVYGAESITEVCEIFEAMEPDDTFNTMSEYHHTARVGVAALRTTNIAGRPRNKPKGLLGGITITDEPPPQVQVILEDTFQYNSSSWNDAPPTYQYDSSSWNDGSPTYQYDSSSWNDSP